jgi:hypothetical protein
MDKTKDGHFSYRTYPLPRATDEERYYAKLTLLLMSWLAFLVAGSGAITWWLLHGSHP